MEARPSILEGTARDLNNRIEGALWKIDSNEAQIREAIDKNDEHLKVVISSRGALVKGLIDTHFLEVAWG